MNLLARQLSFSECKNLPCLDYQKGDRQKSYIQPIATEIVTPVIIHGKNVGTLVSSPQDIKHLAAGYALAEGYVTDSETIEDVMVQDGVAIVKTKFAGHQQLSETDPLTISAGQLCVYGDLLDRLSAAHHTSHGVHEGAIVEADAVIAYAEDIGRHNVLDRLRGTIALDRLDVSHSVLVFSGRVPQSVITKVYHMGISVLASRALPTSLGVQLADQYGITLICGLRPDEFKVFAHPERIVWSL